MRLCIAVRLAVAVVLTMSVVALWGADFTCAAEIHVNNRSGDDLLDGGEPESEGKSAGPVRTIAKALRIAQPGDRIVIANTGEPYRETVSVQGGRNSGVHGSVPFVIEGNGAVIDGTQQVPDFSWEHFRSDIFRARCVIKSHQVLFLAGQPAPRLRIDATSRSKLSLERGQYLVADGFIYFRPEENRGPTQDQPSYAALTVGMTLYDVHDLLIKDLVVQGFAFDGFNAHDNARNVRLENVTCRDNGRSGFTIAGSSQVTLDRCIATSNHVAQVRIEPFAQARLLDCKMDLKSAPAVANEGRVEDSAVKK